jgi:hypothetical protein
MSQQIVPLTSAPNQTFAITLSVDGEPLTLNLTFRYNEIAKYWGMSAADRNNIPLVVNVPLVTGNNPACNILNQFAYLRIGSAFVINQSGTLALNYPDNTDLGTDFILVWGDTPIAEGSASPPNSGIAQAPSATGNTTISAGI